MVKKIFAFAFTSPGQRAEVWKVSEYSQKLHAAVGGNEQALVELLEEFGCRVRSAIRGGIQARWQSLLSEDDVMQETYAEAFLSIRRFVVSGDEPEKGFVKWLQTIARHNLMDAIKALKTAKAGGGWRRVTAAADPEESRCRLQEELGLSTTTPSRQFARKEASTVLQRNLRRLPTVYQQVIRSYDLDGMPATEVAELLRCSVGAMYMKRARALDMLRKLIGSTV